MSRTFFAATGLGLAALLTGCGTTHPLPVYERPIARTEYQTVRTTAYTHTEADHVEYGNHNALGGTLHAASPPLLMAAEARPVSLEPNPTDIVNRGRGFLPCAVRAGPGPPTARPSPTVARPQTGRAGRPARCSASSPPGRFTVWTTTAGRSRGRKHHRSLRVQPWRDERLGSAPRSDSRVALGRPRGEPADAAASSTIPAYPADGSGTRRQRTGCGEFGLTLTPRAIFRPNG